MQGSEFRGQGSGCRVEGSGCRVCGVRTVRSCAMVRASQASRLWRAASYLGMQVYGQRFGCGEFEGWDMGSEIWGLGLEFKVWDLGVRFLGAIQASRLCRAASYLQGYLAHKKTPSPIGPPRTLGIGLRYGPRFFFFLQ